MDNIPYVNIHTHRNCDGSVVALRSYDIGLEFVTLHEGDCAISVGLHPWSADNSCSQSLIESLKSAELVAIGEIGLDFHRDVDRGSQVRCFEEQLKIAIDRDVPVIIHCVKAFEEIMAILRRYSARRVVFHSFVGNTLQIARVVERGYYISISPITLMSSRSVEAIGQIDKEHIFIETDDSDIDIKTMYGDVAKLLGIETLKLKQIVYNNYIKLIKNL